ncbi:UDP-Glycosyltransferase superfamily protein [Actinidia rufa]|uniref:UDP-Glycosyltransferase superfamily protein n=1 Tax=Actinidia rufa TaxID=165716 RepID=A0A7J0FHN2_9ERIC|nr:UDP-Glycosyltransferase superfamily protein [Actinidia rufa]
MVPFPAQGHLNQLLHLSRLISSYHIPVLYVGGSTHIRQAKLRIHGWDPLSLTNVHFHEFPIPSFLSPPPDPNASVKFPAHLQPSFDASSHLREPIGNLLRTLSLTTRRVIVIHDSIMTSVVQDVASIPKRGILRFPQRLGLHNLPTLEGCFTPDFEKFVHDQINFLKHNSGCLYNTSKVIESPYLNLLAKEQISDNKKQWAIGPFNPVAVRGGCNHQGHECLEWLDKQEPNSVIYVSFGTTTCLSDEQIKELAVGLEQSGHKFVWVVRDADKGDVFVGGERRAELPKGFEERVEGRGMLVRDWAPQLQILEHPSTVLKDWSCRDELVTSLMVEDVVKRLMGSEEGEEIRRRAAALGGAVQQSVAKGGVSRLELDSFVAHINR